MGASKILYVDDDPRARRHFLSAMTDRGFVVTTAQDYQEARELCKRTQFPVVVTDLCMPEVDGIELIDRMRDLDMDAAFVLVTGLQQLDLPTQSESARAITRIIHKPWDVEELEQTLRAALDLNSARRRRTEEFAAVSEGEQPRLLLIEDDEADAVLVGDMLKGIRGYRDRIDHVVRLDDGLELMANQSYEVIITDLSLPDARGMDAVAALQSHARETPIIVLSGLDDEDMAVQAVQVGAQDYLIKGEVSSRAFERAIRYAKERKAAQERLVQLAHYDQLTGLANRTRFHSSLSQNLARHRRGQTKFGVVIVDLDGFKAVNDTLGHHVGDRLLVEVASRMRSVVRSADTVARLGGDEFAIIMDQLDSERDASYLIDRLLQVIGEPVVLDGVEAGVTGSIGVAIFPDNAKTGEELLQRADIAMYRAKERGRNNGQFYDAEMHGRLVDRISLERDLMGALTRQEFSLVYQPQMDCQSKQPIGVEVLLRWNHPVRGKVAPDVFVPLLETTGKIISVGDWVLHSACRALQPLCEHNAGSFRFAVNLSPKQFEDPLLVQRVRSALSESNILPACLELEVTEGLLMSDPNSARVILGELKALGVRIAIDDFGTGYSSLSYLAQFPVDVLKIDRSFVQGLHLGGDHDADRTIASSVIQLGHSLGMNIIAEGVEDGGQLSFLEQAGCDIVQGFLFHKPSLIAEIESIWSDDAEAQLDRKASK